VERAQDHEWRLAVAPDVQSKEEADGRYLGLSAGGKIKMPIANKFLGILLLNV
jgi:hypothetical protein